MRYDSKRELVNQGPIFVYSLPEKNAYGLADYSQKAKIKYEQDCKRMNRSLNRFRRIADHPEKAAHGRPFHNG